MDKYIDFMACIVMTLGVVAVVVGIIKIVTVGW